MRTAIIGAVLLVLGVVAVATGLLPVSEALAVADRTWPILLFVVAITVVTELAAEAGLFTAIAERTARWGAHRAWLLWIFVVLLAVVSTVFLSLDTTAVLLTPVVVQLARHNGLPPLPFALTTVWLANTGSLLLPVSNLTNLLAEHALGGMPAASFAAMMALPALVAVLVPCAVLFLIYRRDLLRRYQPGTPEPIDDKVLFRASAITVAALLPLLVSGLPVWMPACAGALVLGVLFAVRRRRVLRFSLVPWQLVVLASGLFLVVETGHALGLTGMLAQLVGEGEGPLALLRLAGTAGVGANAIDNLPAYLLLEPLAESPHRIAALLVGVNAGPLITPWASLATLLWHSRLTSMGVEISWRRYALLGLVVAPLTVVLATLAILV
ncbi:SLC13 family permease [Schumannella soli]|uniref:Arsenic transporter n=1 Tax=Schumannella soli TaxID=2590779 RepID=A0A506Y5A1_9MICO|nr:SLC13 family permease [Schumannella soli]TPW77172.1 arsenic transporter [Schumannella soli]